LKKVLGGRAVVDELDLQVDQGAIFGFLGPNGAGKTTTIRLLLGLSAVTSGEAEVLGEKVPVPPPVLARVGALVEEPGFYPWITGRGLLRILCAGGSPCEPSRADEVLELTGLGKAGDQRVKAYSQGMRQRLGLAAALLRRPRLLVLDEPANGLDPAGLRDLRSLLRQLRNTGTTVFLSSHQLHEVEHLCDRVAIIHHGRVVLEGDPSELVSGGRRIRVTVSPDQTDEALSALSNFEISVVSPGTFLVSGTSGQMTNALLQQRGIVAESIEMIQVSLEEKFLGVTTDEGP
jgi:ABC-2 type transport system ATP-binding protein